MKTLAGYFGKALAHALVLLPRRARLLIGTVIGRLWFDVFRIRRQVAIDNVTIAYPEWPVEKRVATARASLEAMGHTLLEFADFPFLRKETVREIYEFEGLENIDAAMKAGHGAIMLSLHLGNGDFAVAALSRLGYPVNLISKEFKSRWLNDLWFGMRRKHGTRFIAPEKSSFDILRSLKRNELVFFVLDQFMGPPVGVRTKFFGKETGTAAGCALMAGRTKAPVIPCYDYRKSDGRHVAVFEPPIPYLDDGLRDEIIVRMTQTYTDKIESMIRRHPGQWMWIHRRWKEFRD